MPSGPRARGVVLVTGAARGIGAATVRKLSAEGWNVIAVDRAADDPRLPYAMGTVAELQALANERVVASRPTSATPRRSPGRSRSPSGAGAGWTRSSPRPA